MMTEQEMAAKSRQLRGLLQQKLGVRGRDLAQALRRAGRRLPRRIRKQGAALARAEALAPNPKTARQIDETTVGAAYDQMRSYLEKLDVGEMRKGRLLGLAGVIAANLLLIAGLFVLWLWWRGYV